MEFCIQVTLNLDVFTKLKCLLLFRRPLSDFRDKIHPAAEVWFRSQLSVYMWDL
jgi:hypothetical protein